MPALDVDSSAELPAVATFDARLRELLDEAESVKTTQTIEPALNKSDLHNLSQRVTDSLNSRNGAEPQDERPSPNVAKVGQFAIVETAARDIFDRLVASTPIDNPEFVRMWNLFDILSMLSDDGLCDPALLFWLVEELLDSQTIAGCRKIFDFLESRRERITANHFKQKQLVILRSCNELLRRLSRAEDTGFCGRVFIFLFQSFPLGDRSSVNLRGEYHVENLTTYETVPADEETKMEVDTQEEPPKAVENGNGTPARGVTFEAKHQEKPLDPEALYPRFWSLQQSFSQPMTLLEPADLATFKANLEATMKYFKSNAAQESARQAAPTDEPQAGSKRKRGDDNLLETFNPKYLTSKDLFELEISDLSFRRHVLVQAMIIMDFLLSLSKEAKEKPAVVAASNKSVIYSTQLDGADVKWATDMKENISTYLKESDRDGPYFHRMVETVLARDKNWVVWKMASCPPIQRDSISPETFNQAKETAQRTSTNKRLRPVPMGSVSLDFLRKDDDDISIMDGLMAEDKYRLPELDSFKSKISDNDFDLDMATSDEAKAAAIAGKSSKSWRALRIAGRFKLAAFDKIDDPKKVDAVFEELVDPAEEEADDEPAASEENMPGNREPLIVSGPPGVGKSTALERLFQKHPGVFAAIVRHAAREPTETESDGKEYHFVKPAEFNQLRDGDKLVEYGTRDGVDYGTSIKAVEAVTEAGKVPVVELDLEAAQFAKDMGFSARYILLKPSSLEAIGERLRASGKDEAEVERILARVPEEMDETKVGELFDKVIVNEDQDLEKSVEALRAFMFAAKEDEEEEGVEGATNGAMTEVEQSEEVKGQADDDKMADA